MSASVLWFDALDRARRRFGCTLDRIDLGRDESPFDVVHSRPGARLRSYGTPQPGAPALLMVPAPIKRPYIWDISPDRSVVRKALARGFDVYLVEWTDVDDDEARFGLEEYALSALSECADVVRAHSRGDAPFVAGHSLGGTFAALYGAARPQDVGALVLLEAPLHFGEAAGAFKPMLDSGLHVGAVLEPTAHVPGSLLNLISAAASPRTFQFERYADFAASSGSRADLATHWRVERWTLDELALPRRLFEELVEHLYREDRFMRGELSLGGRQFGPRDVTAPLFAVYDPRSEVIPAASVLDVCAEAGSEHKEVMPYLGDVGVALQHVGALVGERAHRDLWPRIFDWLGCLAAR